jgi:hypothetical protein
MIRLRIAKEFDRLLLWCGQQMVGLLLFNRALYGTFQFICSFKRSKCWLCTIEWDDVGKPVDYILSNIPWWYDYQRRAHIAVWNDGRIILTRVLWILRIVNPISWSDNPKAKAMVPGLTPQPYSSSVPEHIHIQFNIKRLGILPIADSFPIRIDTHIYSWVEGSGYPPPTHWQGTSRHTLAT